MLPENKWIQYGLPNMEVKGIVIHNTNNQSWSAERLEQYMNETDFNAGTHYFVDHNEIRQVMPLDWSVWNTGMGMDFGNLHCISIEIVSNPSEKLYEQGERKAIDLIKKLMEEYHLTINDIYFHRDFNHSVNCPAQILKKYGTKQNFLSNCRERIKELEGK